MMPDPARPWYRRLVFLPEGSPYWWLHAALVVFAVACLGMAWPGLSAGPTTRFAWFSAANFTVIWHPLIVTIARRRRPEYFLKR